MKIAAALIAAVTALRLVYLLWFCPYALAEDEAHYWEWALRPDWSYYSKGPGVAWTIWLAVTTLGHDEGLIRVPAVLAGCLLALALAGTARTLYPNAPRAPLLAAALALLTPAYQFAALVMTIDGPYLAAWATAAWTLTIAVQRRANHQPATLHWLAFAAALGAGFLYKYTILLILPGLVGFLITHPKHRPGLRTALAATLIAASALAPVLIWNAQHDWVTVKHLAGHLGLAWGDQPREPSDSKPYNPGWTLEFIGVQLAFAGPTIALAWLGLRRARRAGLTPGERLMLWLAVPIITFYLLITLATDAEPNWPIAGYLTLIPLAARPSTVTPSQHPRLWTLALIYGLTSGLGMLRIDLLASAAQALGLKSVNAGRLLSGPGIGRDIHALRQQLRDQTGLEPLVIAAHYGRASLLAYYLPDRPSTVYSASPYTGGRKSQQDFWTDTNLADPALLGRPAILLGGLPEHWAPAFDSIQQIPNIPSDHKGDRRTLFLGHGYRGFPQHPLRSED